MADRLGGHRSVAVFILVSARRRDDDSGSSRIGPALTAMARRPQHGHDAILEHHREQVPLAAETDLRAIVGEMGLTGDKVHRVAGTLSGGEKTELALSIVVSGRHNLLLLDEPTNNLDPAPPRQWPRACTGGHAASFW